VDPTEIDRLIGLDEAARAVIGKRDDLRGQVKSLSKQVGAARRTGDTAAAEELAALSRSSGEEERSLNAVAESAQEEVRRALLYLPNLPSADAPDGDGPDGNVVVRTWPDLDPTYSEAQRVPHWEIGSALGLLDMERGAKLSGSMFPLYRGFGARLLRALTAFALDSHADQFEEVRPPTMVLTETMVSTGHLPKFEEDAYHLERDGLWAIPTAEVPLTSMWRGDILDEADLPLRLTAATPCFRREAGAAGRDTRGLLRVHEFDKVELFAYAQPDQAPALLDDMVARAERLLQELGLQYRVLDLCAGDMGISAARTFDLEVYAPGVDQWLEVSSVSWCTDYQARRANIRYRPTAGGGPVLVHTLNGSALAWARIWAALVETGRHADGSVVLPEVLRPYLRGDVVIPAAG
jgi:seryl-tRNA synthetase